MERNMDVQSFADNIYFKDTVQEIRGIKDFTAMTRRLAKRSRNLEVVIHSSSMQDDLDIMRRKSTCHPLRITDRSKNDLQLDTRFIRNRTQFLFNLIEGEFRMFEQQQLRRSAGQYLTAKL